MLSKNHDSKWLQSLYETRANKIKWWANFGFVGFIWKRKLFVFTIVECMLIVIVYLKTIKMLQMNYTRWMKMNVQTRTPIHIRGTFANNKIANAKQNNILNYAHKEMPLAHCAIVVFHFWLLKCHSINHKRINKNGNTNNHSIVCIAPRSVCPPHPTLA